MQPLQIFKALGDDSRLRIVAALMRRPMYVEELAALLNVAVSTASFHLHKLEKAGVTVSRREGYFSVYSVNHALLSFQLRQLLEPLPETSAAAQQEAYYRQIVRSYFTNGKLNKMPAAHKKRDLVMRKLLTRFQAGRQYTEREVDDSIKRVFADYCTVRRYFVDNGWMLRKDGIYTVTAQANDEQKQEKRKLQSQVKKDLKNKFRESGPVPGIVKITIPAQGSVYIAGGMNPEAVINRIRFELKTGIRRLPPLLDAFERDGQNAVVFEVIDVLKKKDGQSAAQLAEDIKELKMLWVKRLQEHGFPNAALIEDITIL